MLELLIILSVGIILCYYAYVASLVECPAQKIEYRFIPRTLKEQTENPINVSELLKPMFVEKPLY